MKMSKINLDRILPLVRKPFRYTNCEWNSIHKKGKGFLKFCLCFPDIYEIGMSNLGMQILYNIINSRDDVFCERVYAPDVDLERFLLQKDIPLFSIETKKPLREFDILGFSIPCELSYTNILNILTLGQIPLYSEEREKGFPLVIAGGFAVCNPEPLADFIDAFVLGEGEEVIEEIIDEISKTGYKRGDRKKEILMHLSRIPGVYIPSFYKTNYKRNGIFKEIVSDRENVPKKISKRVVNLEKAPFPVRPLVPLMDIVHNRLTLEIQRGCTRGCRFCQAGMILRPRRERSKTKLMQITEECLKNTGFKDISLLSLSTSDYSQILDLVDSMQNKYKDEKISISLPSLRSDCFFPVLAGHLTRNKKTGLTFAPEAGSQRLRDVINKGITEEEIFSSIHSAVQNGWRTIKLYFMVGLPFERDEDIEAINLLVKKIKNKHSSLNLNFTVSFFVPKPHTPFQWVAQEGMEELIRKKAYLKKVLPGQVRTQQVESSFLEGVFARGDRNLGRVIKEAYFKGCRLDLWTEHFKFGLWQEAFEKEGIDPESYNQRVRGSKEVFCWDHLDFGVEKEFLWKEYKKAKEGKTTKDCSREKCNSCGVNRKINKNVIFKVKTKNKKNGRILKTKKKEKAVENENFVEKKVQKVRIKLKKGKELKYISHLGFIESLRKVLRRTGLPFVYSHKFNPQIKTSFSPALPVGYMSDTEFMDVEFREKASLREIKERLLEQLPVGIKIAGIKKIPLSSPSLESLVETAEYIIKVPESEDKAAEKIREFLLKKKILITKQTKKGPKKINVCPLISSINLSKEKAINLILCCRGGQQVKPELVIRAIFNLSDEETKTLNIKRIRLLDNSGINIF